MPDTTMPARRGGWIWKSLLAALCGTLAHAGLMELKRRAGWLPGFDPSVALQGALASVLPDAVPHSLAPWIVSQANGATIIGLLFGHFFHHIPGRSGLAKGFVLGLAGWLVLGLVLFPTLGFGPLALSGGVAPALFSFAMVQAYSLVLGIVYAALQPKAASPDP